MTSDHNSSEPLPKKFFKGAVWLLASFGLSKIFRMAMTLAIAALLSPEAYGVVTISSVIFVVVLIINEFGIWQTVIYNNNSDERFLSTASTVNLIIGFVVTSGIFVAAPFIADFYAQPEMVLMLRVMGLSLVLEAIAYVPDGLLRKDFRFKDRVVPEIVGAFAAVLVTIALLLLGVGVVSYAVGYLAESIFRCSLTIRIAVKKIRWRFRLRIFQEHLSELFSYAKRVFGTELIKYTSSNIDYFIVGSVLGANSLGFYALAFNLANYPVTNFALILSKITFPAFAALQDDPSYARRVYLKTVQLLAAVIIPGLVVLALTAGPLIVRLLGEHWQPAIYPLQAMVVAGMSRAIAVPGSDILRAIGFPDIPLKVSSIEGFVLLGTLLLIAHRGISAVALAVAIILSLASWTLTVAACHALKIKIRDLGFALLPCLALAASGAGAILFSRLLDLRFLPDAAELVVPFVAAGAAIMLCLGTLCRTFFLEVITFVSSAKSR